MEDALGLLLEILSFEVHESREITSMATCCLLERASRCVRMLQAPQVPNSACGSYGTRTLHIPLRHR
jgi:hypothetical protein